MVSARALNSKQVLAAAVIAVFLVGTIFIAADFSGFFAMPGTQSETIKIGAILPLTGSMAKAGQDAQAALEIAQEDLKAEFPNIEIIFEDDAFQPKQSVTIFNKMAKVDNADAIIGPLNGSSIEAVRPLANEMQMVTFTPWGGASSIGNYLFKNSLEVDDEDRALSGLIVKKLGMKRVGIIYLQNDWGQLHFDTFKQVVPADGGQLVAAEPFAFGTTDYRAQLTKIKEAGIDALYIVHNGAGVGEIAKQAKEIGISAQFFGQYCTESSDLIAAGKESLEGLVYTFPLDEANLSAKQSEFVRKFEAKTGGEPQISAYNSYEIYMLLGNAFAECGKGNSACVRDYLAGLKDLDGVGGKLSFAGGRIVRPMFFKVIDGGKFVPYKGG